MPELPVLKLRELLSVLSRLGFTLVSQKGSHMKYKKFVEGRALVVIVPHYREIPKKVLLSIIRQAGMTREEFIKYC